MPTDPTLPAHKRGVGFVAWFLAGTARPPLALEHRRLAQPAGAAGGGSVACGGRHRGLDHGRRGQLVVGAIIGWWFGWSVYEVLIRLSGRRYVKDGPWWRDHYRVAGVMDMLSYVGFKNLLIGAALFLALKSMGVSL
jgi:NosR/NirI family nitrous oxide reductase transcriptional regulator